MKQFLMLIITQLSRFTPLGLRDRVVRLFGFLWYLIAKGRREVIRENIRTIKGEVKESDIKSTFSNFAQVFSDILNIPNMTTSYLQSMVKADVGYIKEELNKGKGVILIASHLGGMELAGPYLSSFGFPLYSIAESKGPGMKFFRFYNHYREHLGNKILRLEDRRLVFKLVRLLKENKIVVLIADRDIQDSGVDYEFFGRTASIPRGVALLSKRTGAPLIVGFMALDPDTPRYQGRLFPPLYPDDYDTDEELLKAIVMLLEKEISMYPEQWFVFQKVWKD